MRHFCPPGSGFRIRIRIHWPDRIRIRIRNPGKNTVPLAYLLPSSMMPDSLSFSISSSISSVSSCAILTKKNNIGIILPDSVGDPWHFGADPHPDQDSTPFFSDFKGAKRNFSSYFFLITYLQAHSLQSILIFAKILCQNFILQALFQSAQHLYKKTEGWIRTSD